MKNTPYFGRRSFLERSAALAGALLPLPALAQSATVHELSGEVLLNGKPLSRTSAPQAGDTVFTGDSGRVWFSVAGDAIFLRPRSELRLESRGARDRLISALRLITGAMGATFRRGAERNVIARTVTIGIRGTGIYVESSPEESYACTCFGATELKSSADGAMMEGVKVLTASHQARRVFSDPRMGMRVVPAPFEHHTDEEISRLEALAGRPNPFRT